MVKRYLHVAFNFRGEREPSFLEPIFNTASDWIRYTPTTWLVWTNHDAGTWYRRLKPVLAEGDHVFVVEVNLEERAGWLPKAVWNWINEDRKAEAK